MKNKNSILRSVAIAVAAFCSGGVSATNFTEDMSSTTGWVAAGWTPGANAAVLASGGNKIDFVCDNATTQVTDRCVWDKDYTSTTLAYGGVNAFKVKLSVSNNASLDHLTYMVRVPSHDASNNPTNSWHAVSTPVVEGAQESLLPFIKMMGASCAGSPVVCDRVDNLSQLNTLRVNAWRKAGDTQQFTVTIDDIQPVNIPVALLNGDGEGYTEAVRVILKRYKIPFFEVTKAQLTDANNYSLNPLYGAKLVIGNVVTLDSSQGTYIADYLTSTGAKLIGFGPYMLSGSLPTVLGINGLSGSGGRIEAITGMEFTSAAAADLVVPDKLPAVYSWLWPTTNNSSSGADAIAYWISSTNSTDTTTGKPAWLLNSVGAYRDKLLSNVYHPIDNDHVLLALIMKLRPDMATDIVAGVAADTDKFAGMATPDTFGDAISIIDTALTSQRDSDNKSAALIELGHAEDMFASASSGSAHAKVNALLETRKSLGAAYSQVVQPTSGDELKAIWVSSAWGAYPGNWTLSVNDIKAAGFTHISVAIGNASNISFPSTALECTSVAPLSTSHFCFEKNAEWQDIILYSGYNPSPTAPVNPLPAALHNPLQAAIAAAHTAGLKFIAWKKVFTLSGSTAGNRTFWRTNGFAQDEYTPWTSGATTIDALSPCSSAARQMNLDAVSEIASNYDVDGIQLDYIRYDSQYASFDDQCKQGFQAYLNGLSSPPVSYSTCSTSWPEKVNSRSGAPNSTCVTAYRTFLTKVVSDHVADVRTLIDGVNLANASNPGKPQIELSADVYAIGNQDVGQDWPSWPLDRAFPMTYESTLAAFQASVGTASGQMAPFPLHFGLGGFAAPSDIINRQLLWLRTQTGFTHTGFSFFEFNRDSAKNMLPLLTRAIAFPDEDGDGVHDEQDNCPSVANPEQGDFDNDGIGDYCDETPGC